jgi:hypothetical protein
MKLSQKLTEIEVKSGCEVQMIPTMMTQLLSDIAHRKLGSGPFVFLGRYKLLTSPEFHLH